MLFTDLFKMTKTCTHDHISPDMECGYCPDCGKLIENEWYITRCACCGVKLKTMSRGGKIVPQMHYCTNCGGKEFEVEKIEKINFIDINFAVLVKKEAEAKVACSTTQCWQERTDAKPKLLTQFL